MPIKDRLDSMHDAAKGWGLLTSPSRYQVTIACGMGCMLAYLMASLSGQLTAKSGMSYSDPWGLIVSVATIIALTMASHVGVRRKMRIIMSATAIALCVIWLILLAVAIPPQTLPSGASLAQATFSIVGRLFGILLALLWSLHFCLQYPAEAIRSIVVSVFIASGLYIIACLAQGAISLFFFGTYALISSLACLYIELRHTGNSDPHHSLDAVSQRDRENPISHEGQKRTRLLYFGSRLVYGLMAGSVIGVSLSGGMTPSANPTISALVLVMLAILVALSLMIHTNDFAASTVTSIICTPFAIVTLVLVCFSSQGFKSAAPITAMMIELVWSIQLFSQLPSYRAMTGMSPVAFAWFDRMISIISYVFSMSLIHKVIGNNLPSPFVAAVVAGVCLAVVTIYSVISLVRHFLLYYPRDIANKEAASVPNDHPLTMAQVGIIAADHKLTQRETEVLGYLAMGYSRPYIGKVLNITEGTTKVHAHHIYQKLNVGSQDELIELLHSSIANN